MRHTWGIYWVSIVLAVAVVMLPSCATGNHSATPAPAPPPESADHDARALREQQVKEQIMQRDMAATEKLSKRQSVRDAQRFMQQHASDVLDRSPAAPLRQFLKEHPEAAAVAWIVSAKRHWTEGAADKLNGDATAARFTQARKAVHKGAAYASPTFRQDGRSYYMIGEPAPVGKGKGIIALLSASAIEDVGVHQRQNLRLIPFPAEGRYRMESVRPNTTQDITVRKGEDNGNASHYAIDEVVVKFSKPLTAGELLKLRKELDLTIIRRIGQTYVFRSGKHRTESLITYFRKLNPIYVEPHYLYLTNGYNSENSQSASSSIVPNDTLYADYQWNLPQIETEQGWNVSRGNENMVVAVIDTGVQLDHPDLQGRLVNGLNVVDPSQPPDDDVGHGTHVAGIIAAQVNNHEGVAGLTWYTKIMPIKALDSTGAGSTYAVSEGVIWAADHGANVINMSLGNYADAQFLHDAIQYAHSKGVLVVAASGNDNTDRPGYPAAYPEVLAVAATNPGGDRAGYSNYGDYIDVAAPGTSIASTYPGSRYAAMSGTSMASPHAAALASLVLAANPDLSNTDVVRILRDTALDLGPEGIDPLYGYGQIDIRRALQAASGQVSSQQGFPGLLRRKLEQLIGSPSS